MLEGAVARLLNQILGKYVVDLDTENLNVGIFSGQVQLNDLKLKPEALYELKLPIEIKAGTIGRVTLQIPWTSLWSQSIVVNIEDVYIIANPLLENVQEFDKEKNKRLLRAAKKKLLAELDNEGHILGGPKYFAEHLMGNIMNYLQININNVHIRYEDTISSYSVNEINGKSSNTGKKVSAGICIGSITAESVNSKWKPAKFDKNAEAAYYLVKMEAFCVYWNPDSVLEEWEFPGQYYQWRNSMGKSLQNYQINEEDFQFLLNPLTLKIRTTINGDFTSSTLSISKINTDIIVQDCTLQMSKSQYESINMVAESLNRMLTSWQFVHIRPKEKILQNRRAWWRYAYDALLEQRVRPYTWSSIKSVRNHYKDYLETYKQIILNPNDTELKLDLQKFEDNLNIINIVCARQQARLTLQSRSINEKNFWSMLPSPERLVLCEKIGYLNDTETIAYVYTFRLGNLSATLLNNSGREILMATITQTSLSYKPSSPEKPNRRYKISMKVEGVIIEGASAEEHLMPIIASEHNSDSPAYCFRVDLERLEDEQCRYRLSLDLSSVECIYNKQSFDELEVFFTTFDYYSLVDLLDCSKKVPRNFYKLMHKNLLNKWDMKLNIHIPFVVIPDTNSFSKAENLLVLDLGKYSITTEICRNEEVADNATQNELEEQLYSKLFINCTGAQVLFCDNGENWKDARREKDTDMHVISKSNFSSIYAVCVSTLPSLPRYKFSINFPMLKFNVSERKLALLLRFFNKHPIPTKVLKANVGKHFEKDRIVSKITTNELVRVQNLVTIDHGFAKSKRKTIENGKVIQKERGTANCHKNDMNEVWAKTVDLPGLDDNVSPHNNINILLRFVINDLTIIYSRSSDSTDRQYLMLRLGLLTADVALMTYGPAYQLSINNIFLTDKLHTTPSGQYLDLIHSPIQNNTDVITILYRKVNATCPDFWSHFHGVETSLVANFGIINVLLHQEAVHTIIKYWKYFTNKLCSQVSPYLKKSITKIWNDILTIFHKKSDPVPPGSVKFSHSARLVDLSVTVCDADFDIVNIQLSGLEMDFLFRANERFVFRSYLSNINVEHLSEVTLYSKVLSTDEDKVFEFKYVRNSSNVQDPTKCDPNIGSDGSFKFQLGRMHYTFLYKLIVQLQRFIINLEALPFLERTVDVITQAVNKATDTLAASTKINLSINVCGPVLLFPQKSSSPNVLVIDTGELLVENFFKESQVDNIENILVKLNGITITRGVMTLTPSLEMQETLVEPINLNLDIKRFTNRKSLQKAWDIDSIIDSIQVTLGQKDLSIILAIYTDNIGEGKIIDLFPNQIKSPVEVNETDDTVKSLEAFFCEPKQKNIVAKCVIEEIQLLLFFDSGELLSSPIRDLNHGLCKMAVLEIDTSFVAYTDRSLDGKLSIDNIYIEEIGPDANAFDKIILQSPSDESKNNNCNITINKPPIIDVNFHQNKSKDKTADIIIGRLSLSLSIPFAEKLALFIIECLPKENLEMGIINRGYEAECQHPQNSERAYTTSLTISLRINRPEIIFLVETTSNKKRYFITKSEILLDYSRHGNRLNLVASLSGLHSLFYDLGIYSCDPYVILKQCDVEFCNSFSDDKGEKITLTISSIYIKLCSEVVHSINDILNDIVEHFKLPPEVVDGKKLYDSKSTDGDLWEPKKMNDFLEYPQEIEEFVKDKLHEVFLVPKFEVVVILELEQVQVFLFKSTIELTMYGWSSLLNCSIDFTIQANFFNESNQQWEPIIDPTVIDEREYRPFEIFIKIFQDKALPMFDDSRIDGRSSSTVKKKQNQSYNTTEDEDFGEDMMYLEPMNSINQNNNRRVKTSLSTFLDDSDSENDESGMGKLAAAISDLFTGDWNEHEDSDCDHSSEDENDDDEIVAKEKPEKEKEKFKKALYVLVDTKETLNITITPKLLKSFNDLFTIYSNKILSVFSNKETLNLTNDIGPNTRVELYQKSSDSEENTLIVMKTFENEDSVPNSPSKSFYFVPELIDNFEDLKDTDNEEENGNKFDIRYDFETLNSLHFPLESTASLFDRINKHFMKIYVPNFLPIQTNCSNRNWEKLIRMHSTIPSQTYYLAAKHFVGKNGRNVVISSPLQIKNETCFALSILYQPSALRDLNIEPPPGEITNPFESTMRITVLEAYDQFNVPLYIAYHSKIFIQPAYAENHYASNSSIWWIDLATELDMPHNFICHPKSDSNLELFSLRVVLKRNIDTKISQTHSIPNYVIHLLPPLIIHNVLPYSLEVENLTLKQLIKVDPGEKSSVYSLDLTKDQKLLVKLKYKNTTWTGNLNLTAHLEEKILILNSEGKETVAINVRSDWESSCNVFFYTPYWIVNKTTLPIQIKVSSTNSFLESNEDILLFTYKRHGKQTLNMRVYESNWSNDFGLECAGTTGLIVCKDPQRRKKYLFFLKIDLANICPKLTKIVTLLPSFIISNNTDKFLRFMEHNEKTDLWIDLPPSKQTIFWPETSSMQIYVKYRESKLISQAFFISTHHRTVLRLDKGGALTVEVTGGVSEPFSIALYEYHQGDAPILIKNYCADIFLKIQQQDLSPVTLLSPYNSLLYTWDDPTRPRQLVWNVYNNKGSGFNIDITRDDFGEEKIKFHSVSSTPNTSVESSSSEDSDSSDSVKNSMNKKVRKDKIVIYWICYREGLQRLLLFTQELRIYKNVLKNYQEKCQIECLLSMGSVHVSIFTEENATKEHLLVGLNDSPAIWEVNVGHKWKILTLELASWIEEKYNLHYKKCQLKDYIHIDFEKMFMLKPFFAELRRTYHPALYFQFRKSRNYQHYGLKLQNFQIDNKESNTVCFYNAITNINGNQENFIDFSLSKINVKDCNVFRYIKLGIGNFYVNLESDVILKICGLMSNFKKFGKETNTGYIADISSIHKNVLQQKSTVDDCKTIIENIAISSFIIQLNMANKSGQSSLNNDSSLQFGKILNYIFPYNISPYMPMEGVHYKISSIESVDVHESFFNSIMQLFQQIQSQYLQQHYSSVLGLQVLVNSFAIQPNLDIIVPDEEKMPGIVLYGSRCLLGHINMSPAALEQCVIDIFANQNMENIQRFRRHSSYFKNEIIPRSITASSRNFSTGVPLALAQLIVKNQNGVSCDGEMFFKTTGKALISLLTRHPEEKSNSVEVAKEALRRASLLGEPIKIHQRLTRYVNKYLGLKPMSVYDSMGHHLLETVGNSRFINDTYWSHAAVDKVGKSIILVSLEHLIRVNKCRLWGQWEVEWVMDLDDIVSMPKITSSELVFNVRQGDTTNCGQIKIAGDKEILVWLHEKIEQAIIVSMEDKSWALT